MCMSVGVWFGEDKVVSDRASPAQCHDCCIYNICVHAALAVSAALLLDSYIRFLDCMICSSSTVRMEHELSELHVRYLEIDHVGCGLWTRLCTSRETVSSFSNVVVVMSPVSAVLPGFHVRFLILQCVN